MQPAMATLEGHTEESKAERSHCDFDEINETRSAPSPCEIEESRKVWSWELYLDGLDEGTSECSVGKNEAVQGDGKWKKGGEQERLGDLTRLLWKKKSAAIQEVARKRRMKSDFEETGLDDSDSLVQQAIEFRQTWKSKWHGLYGRFEDVTLILPMRYTYQHAPPLARPCNSLQVYSAKVAAIRGTFQCPLHVFGMVAIRDSVDRNRNLVFYRRRENCQTLTEKDPHLVLTGPTRTVVVTDPASDPVIIEFDLKVKGAAESDDRYLSYLAVPLTCSSGYGSSSFEYISKHSTLELTVGEVGSAVEATIFIQVVAGSWPVGFHGQFAASNPSTDHRKVVLLDFGDHKVSAIDKHGYVILSRQVFSVEVCEELKVSVEAWKDGCKVVEEEVVFTPEKAGRSYGDLCLGSCKLEVLVAWSLVLPEPQPDVPDSFEGYLDDS
ncbi:hypothetical protein EJB05_11140 [Eragrostis curvula]|uniref:DUF6598 domain-containing protein n=1 Tax=Eragrostis curvula TaxID=38414 RepID=A0A5J9VQV1_9POAL|nr:hypothetical protein EJB05_11140 [Eragrostis curvula]